MSRDEASECQLRLKAMPFADLSRDFLALDVQLRLELKKRAEIIAGAVARFRDENTLLAYRTTLALACLRLNQPQAARSLYRDMQVDVQTATPGWQAVYAAVLGANGETEAALQLARAISRDRLEAEERTLIEPFR